MDRDYRKRVWTVVAGFGLGLLAATADAQPVVGSVSGVASNDQTMVIAGSAFGTKPTAAPLVWEDFDDGVLHQDLAPHGVIAPNNTDNLRHSFTSRNARTNFKVTNANGDGNFFEYTGSGAPKWFVQYWIKLASNWSWGTTAYGGGNDGLANIKFFRMFPNGGRTYTNAGYSMHGFSGGDVMRFVEKGAQPYLGVDGRSWFTPNTWHNVQVLYGDSGLDQANGTMKLWVDGVLRDSMTTVVTNVGSDGSATDKRPYVIGFYDSWAPSDASVSNMYGYYGDIYVDNNWSRVELGDASTYVNTRHREIQIPTAWGASSVSVKINQGSFGSGQIGYLYVTDSLGRVNANGFPVTIGGGTVTPPSAPTNLRVVR